MQNDNASSSYDKKGKKHNKLKKFLLKNGTTLALISSLVAYFAVQKHKEAQPIYEPREVTESTLKILDQKRAAQRRNEAQEIYNFHRMTETALNPTEQKGNNTELKNLLFEETFLEKSNYTFIKVPKNNSKNSRSDKIDENKMKKLKEHYRNLRVAVASFAKVSESVLENKDVLKDENSQEAKIIGGIVDVFPDILSCSTLQDVAYKLYEEKEAAGIETDPINAMIAYRCLLRADEEREKDSKNYLRNVCDAMLLAPELVTNMQDMESVRDMTKAILSGENRIVIVPSEGKLVKNENVMKQVLDSQRVRRA